MRLKNYLYLQLAQSFFPIFLSLFFITSLISLIKIAALTAVVSVSILELLTLYYYMIPDIVFYTLPITFFIALVVTLAKLSNEYELIVFTSFGLNPLKILKALLPISIMVTLILLVISFALIPKFSILKHDIINLKKKEANFNIKPSQFGQKFGNWFIYIDKKNGNSFQNIKLFKVNKNLEQFILAKNAKLKNDNGKLSFVLYNGKAFILKPSEYNQINYQKMIINDSLGSSSQDFFSNPYTYWKRNFKQNYHVGKFVFNFLISLFPLLSMLLVVAFGYYNPRYEKNLSIAYAIISIIIFYILSNYLANSITFKALIVLPLAWIIASIYLYIKKVKPIY